MTDKAFGGITMATMLTVAALAPQGASAVVGGYLVDGEVCASDALAVTYRPGDVGYCLDRTVEFFDARGDAIALERMFEDDLLCGDGDPLGLARIYRIAFIDDHVEDVQEDLTAELRAHDCVDEDPAATPVELDCQVSALAQPAAFAGGWNHAFIDLQRERVAGISPRIAVLDTGVDGGHPELSGKLELGDAINYATDGAPWDLDDQHGHGTHIAGVIASVAPDARLIPVRVLEGDGVGDWSAAARGLLHGASRGADVVNMSLGTPAEMPAFFETALAEAVECFDVVVVAAAGRSCDMGAGCSEVFWPARHPYVLAVGAVDHQGEPERRTTGGEALDLLAPGVHVCSAWPTYANDAGPMDYRRWSGSSVSTAHAAAVAGLVRAAFPTLDQWDVRNHLVQTAVSPVAADPCTGEAGWLNACSALGWGDCAERGDLLGHTVGQTCEGDEDRPRTVDTVFVAGSAVPAAHHGCQGVADVFVTMPEAADPPAYYCPDEKPVAPLTCSARLRSQPPKTSCPDCDVEIQLANFAELNLRFKHPELSTFTSFLLRLRTDQGDVFVYPLAIGPFPQGMTRAKVRTQVETKIGAPDLYDVVAAELVSLYEGPLGKKAWVADPLWIRTP
jgi:hypothetical protein